MPTLFEQILRLDNLREAWNEVEQNKGTPGVDQVSLGVWKRNYKKCGSSRHNGDDQACLAFKMDCRQRAETASPCRSRERTSTAGGF